ncbi:MAG: DUF6014 family protein [Hydrococcus sp. Prado102]|jgi:hypothetical protein|nr:DUF6014 family protein [Hydrococcus sp. Prado102]
MSFLTENQNLLVRNERLDGLYAKPNGEKEVNFALKNARYLFNKLRLINYPCLLNESLNKVQFKKPPVYLVDKWQLAIQGVWAEIIVTPAIDRNRIDAFIEELKACQLPKNYFNEETLNRLAVQIIEALEKNDRARAAIMLRHLATSSSEFSEAYLLRIANALETDNWDAVADDFIKHNFIGRNDYILIVGPFRRNKEGQGDIKLTAIFGRIDSIPLPIEDLEVAAREAFGQLLQPLAPTFAIESIAACGNIGEQEAFLPPDCWCLSKSDRGPALVNMTAHQERLKHWTQKRIRRIFEPETANLILQLLDDKSMQFQEYWLHEAGHAAGMGLKLKIEHDLFPTFTQSGWEEYKTDIAGFYLAAKVLTPEQVGRLVAATFCIRFGIDAHRLGGPEKDHDVFSCVLLLDRLLLSGQFQLLENNQLRLLDVSYEGLYKATIPHRLEAEALIQQELAAVDNPSKIMEFYSWQQPHPFIKMLLDRLIERCR